jgi:hypothetical protein
VADIRFTLTDDRIPPLSAKEEKTAARRELSENDLLIIEETSGLIKDPKLRDIFRNAMSKSFTL